MTSEPTTDSQTDKPKAETSGTPSPAAPESQDQQSAAGSAPAESAANDAPTAESKPSGEPAAPARETEQAVADSVSSPQMAADVSGDTPVTTQPGTTTPANDEPASQATVDPSAGQGSDQQAAAGEGAQDAKPKVAIGTQREGVAPTAPKAVETAKANRLVEEEGASQAEPLPEVRSTIGLGDDDTEIQLDDAELASMMDSQQSESDVDELTVGEKYKGTVSRLHNEDVFISIKGRFDGVVSSRSFKKLPEIGAMLDVIVSKYDQAEGIYELRIPGGAIDVGEWDDLSQGSVVEVKITGSNTGGLECSVNNIRGFIPGSHIDIARVENFGDFVGQKMEVMIQEVNPKKKKLVLSRRAILEKERQARQKEVLENIESGVTTEGVVTRLMDFGAFIDIGGVEGLAHVSKLSWDRVNHPKDVVSVGQKVKVKIEKVNKETGKISLSIKDTIENPWLTIAERYPDGTVVKGKVTRTTDFGAFVRIEDGIEGLIHISELTHGRVPSVNSAVKVGDDVEVKILNVDTRKRRIGLSRKATMEPPKTEGRGGRDREPVEENVREMAVKPIHGKLKGGRGDTSGGEQFGLKW